MVRYKGTDGKAKGDSKGEVKGKGDSKGFEGKGKGGDGKGKSSSERAAALFASKEYKDGLDELTRKTPARPSDIDTKALQLLDFLLTRGKAKEACAHLEKTLEPLTRDYVSNWRAYIYTLLRQFDADAYKAMKEGTCSARRPRGERKEKGLADKGKPTKWNIDAVEFIPGVQWGPPAPTPDVVAEGTIAATDDTGEADAPAEAAPAEAGPAAVEEKPAEPEKTPEEEPAEVAPAEVEEKPAEPEEKPAEEPAEKPADAAPE